MSWTSITGDTSWQDLAIAGEIRDAYNLRRSAAGLSTMAAPDESVTVFDFIYAVQAGIEALRSYFSDPSVDLEALSDYPVAFASTAAMLSAAGLTGSGGWRRIAAGGTQPATWTDYAAAGWSYGKITDGDLAGPWLFQDIQSALTALTRRVYFSNTDTTYEYFANEALAEATATGSPPSLSGGPTSYSGNYNPISAYCAKTIERSGSTVDYTLTCCVAKGSFYSAVHNHAHNWVFLLKATEKTLVGSASGSFWGEWPQAVGVPKVLFAGDNSSASSHEVYPLAGTWSTWSSFESASPYWPDVPAADGTTQSYQYLTLEYEGCFVIDYLFNP